MEALTIGELFSMDLNYPVIIISKYYISGKHFSWFLKPGGLSLGRVWSL